MILLVSFFTNVLTFRLGLKLLSLVGFNNITCMKSVLQTGNIPFLGVTYFNQVEFGILLLLAASGLQLSIHN